MCKFCKSVEGYARYMSNMIMTMIHMRKLIMILMMVMMMITMMVMIMITMMIMMTTITHLAASRFADPLVATQFLFVLSCKTPRALGQGVVAPGVGGDCLRDPATFVRGLGTTEGWLGVPPAGVRTRGRRSR